MSERLNPENDRFKDYKIHIEECGVQLKIVEDDTVPTETRIEALHEAEECLNRAREIAENALLPDSRSTRYNPPQEYWEKMALYSQTIRRYEKLLRQ